MTVLRMYVIILCVLLAAFVAVSVVGVTNAQSGGQASSQPAQAEQLQAPAPTPHTELQLYNDSQKLSVGPDIFPAGGATMRYVRTPDGKRYLWVSSGQLYEVDLPQTEGRPPVLERPTHAPAQPEPR